MTHHGARSAPTALNRSRRRFRSILGARAGGQRPPGYFVGCRLFRCRVKCGISVAGSRQGDGFPGGDSGGEVVECCGG